MKWEIILAVALAGGGVAQASAHAAQAEEVTLSEACTAAQTRTQVVPLAKASLEEQQGALGISRSGLLPEVVLQGEYVQRDPSAIADGDVGQALTESRVWSASIGIRQPLFHGLRRISLLRSARTQEQAERTRVQQARITACMEGAHAFFEVLASQRDLGHLKDLLALTRQREKELKKRASIGRSREGEVLTAQAQAQTVLSLVEAGEAAIRQAQSRFYFVTGLDGDSTLVEPEAPLPKKLEPLKAYLKDGQARPEILALGLEARAAESLVSAAKGGYFPQLDLVGNYYLKRTGVLEGSRWDLGIALTFPIFQGGIVRSEVRQQSAILSRRELLLAQERRFTKSEILATHQEVTAGLAQVTALERAVEVSRKNYLEQSKDYQFGQVTNLDVIQALNNYQENKRSLDRVRYETRIAWIALQALAGRTPTAHENL